MAREAERLARKGRGRIAETLPAFLADGEDNKAEDTTAPDPEEPHAVAAE